MARTARDSRGDICTHVINRGIGCARVFHDQVDYREFVKLMAAALLALRAQPRPAAPMCPTREGRALFAAVKRININDLWY